MADDRGGWGPGIIGITAFLEALVLVTIVLRVYTRIWVAKAFWWDDVAIILAVLGTTIGAALCFVEVHYGFGTRQAYLTPYQLREFLKYTYGEWIQTFATLMWTKVSICLFLIRIPDSKRLKTPMYLSVAFMLVSNIVLTIIWIMQCQPLHVAWYGEGTCMDQHAKEAVILTQAIISIISDFAFASFPFLLLWRLQIDLKTKAGLWMLMCLGFITGACCIVRTVLNDQSLPADASYGGVVNWVWRTFEVQIGIIAACIPSLRPLYTMIAVKSRGETLTPSDPNIKILKSDSGQHNWVEDGNLIPEPSRGHGVKTQHGEAIAQDLVNEGILKPSVSHAITVQSKFAHRGSEAHLRDDMERYGIVR